MPMLFVMRPNAEGCAKLKCGRGYANAIRDAGDEGKGKEMEKRKLQKNSEGMLIMFCRGQPGGGEGSDCEETEGTRRNVCKDGCRRSG